MMNRGWPGSDDVEAREASGAGDGGREPAPITRDDGGHPGRRLTAKAAGMGFGGAVVYKALFSCITVWLAFYLQMVHGVCVKLIPPLAITLD